MMVQVDAEAGAEIPGVKMIVVGDVYEGRLAKAKEVFGEGTFVSRDYRTILGRKDVDAAIVATPDHWHATIASEAMRAGKDCDCQKPMVRRAEEGAGVGNGGKEAGRTLQVGSR